MVRRALALVVPLALAELVAAALFQLPLRTSSPSVGTRSRPPKNHPVANWQRLAALQRQHGHPEAPTQHAQDEERQFFTELLAEVMGGHHRIPEMFSDLVGGLPSARQTVALAAATQSGLAASPKAQLDMSSHDEFVAQVTFGRGRSADLVSDACSGDLWIVDDECRATVSRPLHTKPPAAVLRTGARETAEGTLVATVTKLSGVWDVEVVRKILGYAIPSLPSDPSASLCQALVEELLSGPQTYSFDFEGPEAERVVVRTAKVEAAERGVGWIASDIQPEWRVDFTGLASSNGTAAISSMDSFLDPSLNAFAILPPADAADLHSKISHHSMVERIHDHPGFWSFDCDASWPLSLHLEGTSITVPPTGLNLGRVSPGSNRCVSGIIGSVAAGRAVFGMHAMKSMRTYFDVGGGQIGLDLSIRAVDSREQY